MTPREIDYFDYYALDRAGQLPPGRYLVLLDPETVHLHQDDPKYLDALGILGMSAILQAQDAAGGSIRRCRVCKCTDARACVGGCYWVARDLCSACAAEIDQGIGGENGLRFEN